MIETEFHPNRDENDGSAVDEGYANCAHESVREVGESQGGEGEVAIILGIPVRIGLFMRTYVSKVAK